MKKMYFWMLALLMVGGMTCVSCDDDDEKDNGGGDSKNELVGVWASTDNPIPIDYDDDEGGPKAKQTRLILPSEEATHEDGYMIFREDGTFYGLDVYFKQNGSKMVYLTFDMNKGTYKVKNGKITVTYDDDSDPEDGPLNVKYSIKSGKLTIYDDKGNGYTFKRVEESEVKEYLDQYEKDEEAKKLLATGYWAYAENPYKDSDGDYWRYFYEYNLNGSCQYYEFYFGNSTASCKSGVTYGGHWDIIGGYYYESYACYDGDGDFFGYDTNVFTYSFYTNEQIGRVYLTLSNGENTWRYFQVSQSYIDDYLPYLNNDNIRAPMRSFAPHCK